MEREGATIPDCNCLRSQTEKRLWQQWGLKMNPRNHTLQDLRDAERGVRSHVECDQYTWIKPSALSQVSDASEKREAEADTLPVLLVDLPTCDKGRARTAERAKERRKRVYNTGRERRDIGVKRREKKSEDFAELEQYLYPARTRERQSVTKLLHRMSRAESEPLPSRLPRGHTPSSVWIYSCLVEPWI